MMARKRNKRNLHSWRDASLNSFASRTKTERSSPSVEGVGSGKSETELVAVSA